jgi:hypothetical protein
MLPLPQRSRAGGASAEKQAYAMFYYANEPQNLAKETPHGVITFEAATSVECCSNGEKDAFCLRLSNAHQQMRRTTKLTCAPRCSHSGKL